MVSKAHIVDLQKLLNLLIPIRFHKPTYLGVLTAFIQPFKDISTKQQLWRDGLVYQLTHNGQVIYLEKVLNEHYEVSGYDSSDHIATRFITITDGTKLDQVYFNERTTDDPVYFNERASDDPVYFNERDTYENAFFHFTINVPSAMTYDAEELRSIVQFYINTKRFRIVEI